MTSAVGSFTARTLRGLSGVVGNRQGNGHVIPVNPIASINNNRSVDPQDPVFVTVDFSKLKDLKIDAGNQVEIPISKGDEKITIKVSYVKQDADNFRLSISLDKKLDGVEVMIKKRLWEQEVHPVVIGTLEDTFIIPVGKGETIYINGKQRIVLHFLQDEHGNRKLTVKESLDVSL